MKPLVLFLLTISSFQAAVASSADTTYSRLNGADCMVKQNDGKSTHSVLVSLDTNAQTAKVALYEGPRNPVNTSVGLIALQTLPYQSLVGFPTNENETVAIRLDGAIQELFKRNALVIKAKIRLADDERIQPAYLSNPLGEEEDIELSCTMYYASTNEDIAHWHMSELEKSDNPSICKIEFEKPKSEALEWVQGCTASIISHKHLLTAGHCQNSFANIRTRIVCGKEVYSIADWQANPAFKASENSLHNDKDTSIITVKERLSGPPLLIELNKENIENVVFQNTSSCSHYGAGRRQDDTMGVLFKAPYQLPSAFLGGASFVRQMMDMSHMLASNPENFLRPGDSGGPIVCNINGQDKIVAVHSLVSTSNIAALSALTSESASFIEVFTK